MFWGYLPSPGAVDRPSGFSWSFLVTPSMISVSVVPGDVHSVSAQLALATQFLIMIFHCCWILSASVNGNLYNNYLDLCLALGSISQSIKIALSSRFPMHRGEC